MQEKLSREEAKVRGLKRYHGKVCHKHPELDGERYASSDGCTGCLRDRDRARKQTPEYREKRRAYTRGYATTPKRRAYMREYDRERAKTPKRREYVREYEGAPERREKKRERWQTPKYREHDRARKQTPEYREKKRESDRAYSKTPEGRAFKLARQSKRRALRKNAEVNLTAAEHHTIAAMHAEAARLTQDTGYAWHVHHVRALSRGGRHHPDNLEVIPAEINLRIGDKELTFRECVGLEDAA